MILVAHGLSAKLLAMPYSLQYGKQIECENPTLDSSQEDSKLRLPEIYQPPPLQTKANMAK
jgi:hypothetical protein